MYTPHYDRQLLIQCNVHSIRWLQLAHYIIGKSAFRIMQLPLCAYFMLHILTADPYLHLCTEDTVTEFYQVQHTIEEQMVPSK